MIWFSIIKDFTYSVDMMRVVQPQIVYRTSGTVIGLQKDERRVSDTFFREDERFTSVNLGVLCTNYADESSEQKEEMLF